MMTHSEADISVRCHVLLLGPVTVLDTSGKVITPRTRKSQALLAMLAVSPRGSRSRSWLRDKLWSDRSEEQSSASLRQALLDIRKSLGGTIRDILITDRHTVTLDLSCVNIDLIEAIERGRSGEIPEEIEAGTIAEHFLEGINIHDPEFEEWLTLERQIWARRFQELTNINQSGARGYESPDKDKALPNVAPVDHPPVESDTWPQAWLVSLLDPILAGGVGRAPILATIVTDWISGRMAWSSHATFEPTLPRPPHLIAFRVPVFGAAVPLFV
jgi:hypothetical protein